MLVQFSSQNKTLKLKSLQYYYIYNCFKVTTNTESNMWLYQIHVVSIVIKIGSNQMHHYKKYRVRHMVSQTYEDTINLKSKTFF